MAELLALPTAEKVVADDAPRPPAGGRFRPGTGITDARPGDVVLIHGVGRLATFIRFFQRLRYRSPNDRPLTYWSHAALVVHSEGYLIEVLHTGVVMSSIKKYRDQDYYCVRLGLSEADRRAAARFAFSCLRQKYGALGFVLLGFSLLSGDLFEVPDRGQQGCAAMIVRALEQAGLKFDRKPPDMMPCDLAKHFGVVP
ncbi:MAG: hypothetical protein JO273_10140 [Methylobacteriaceae bacterium]|nr:hypothetical protein [Methylobacteriaceae bacterium]